MIPTQKAHTSLVLITVDCLRADHLGFMGYALPTTPFLDALAHESIVFHAAMVAGAPTYYSVPAILASRYPLALGRDVVGLAPDEPTLATALRQAGYRTAAFGAANPYLSSRFGYQSGFDVFHDFHEDVGTPPAVEDLRHNGWASRFNRKLENAGPMLGPLKWLYDELYFHYGERFSPAPKSLDTLRRFPAADVVVDRACQWLASIGGSPFFLWLHLMDPHAPYYPKEAAFSMMRQAPVTPTRARFLNSYWNRAELGPRRLANHRGEIINLYDAGIRWIDTQAQRLVEFLRGADRWDDCIFAVTADHGEEFLDHGGRFHPPSRLMEEIIRVPLLMRVPAVGKSEVVKSPFSLLHLAPTLLEGAQISIPGEFQGRGCWQQLLEGQMKNAIAISECVSGCTNPLHSKDRMGSRILSIREARYKLILDFEHAKELLYDLEADPNERAPLPRAAERTMRRRLLEIALEHVRHSRIDRDWRLRTRARLREIRLEWTHSADKAKAEAS